MNDAIRPDREPTDPPRSDPNTLSPLPGEPGIPNVAQRIRTPMSRKGLLAIALLVLSLIVVSAVSIQRFVSSGKKADDGEAKRVADRPAAASTEPRKLEVPTPIQAGVTPTPATPRIPALQPTPEEAEPIAVRRTGSPSAPSGTATASKNTPPADAPIMIVTSRPQPAPSRATRAAPGVTTTEVPQAGPDDPLAATTRNLEEYREQLQGLLDTLTRSTALATKEAIAQPGVPIAPPTVTAPLRSSTTAPSATGAAGLFGGQLPSSSTPHATAGLLGKRSLTLPKGTAFTCALKTKVISATSGLVGCQVQRNVYSDDGRVLLIERGSHLDGEYRTASLRAGSVRIPVLWTRIRTPHGVTVDIDSPGTGALGESGIDGYVDNRWLERIGAAMLLSLIDDSVKLVLQNQSNERQGDTIVLSSTTANTTDLAEKVLESTINIPPLLYQNQGGVVGIYVARDVDFSSVYELQPSSR